MKINYLYEDSDLLVVDKPSGVIVNQSNTTAAESTLQDLVKDKIGVLPKLSDEFSRRGGIVHRLDKETSGIILLAKTPFSFQNLQAQFKQRLVKKEYIALCHGDLIPLDGVISAPLGRLPWNRRRFGVMPQGREAQTEYKVIEKKDFVEEILSLLRLFPRSGRTHQIRVHLKFINHPIFSDELYGGRKTARADRKLLPRLFLHASKITFAHPATSKILSFESPLPPDLENFLKMLKFKYVQ